MRTGTDLAHDLDREQAVADRLSKLWNVRLVRSISDTSRVDYAALNDEDQIVGLVEIKGRYIASTDYSTTTFDATKLAHLRYMSSVLGVPALVVFQWTDRAGYIHADRVNVAKYDDAQTRRGDVPKLQAHVPTYFVRPLWDGDAA